MTTKPKNWTEERPWGRFLNLIDDRHFKVKWIEVDPHQRLSYQSHRQRRESWTVVKGTALVVLNDQEIRLGVGDNLDIPVCAKHRLMNPLGEVLHLIEVQTGDNCEESDIERFADDYGRIR